MAIAAFIGVDSQNAGCVKIMASDIYNPYSTPDTDYAKFLFNSKYQTMRFAGIVARAYSGSGQAFTPAGTGTSNFLTFYDGYLTNIANYFIRSNAFPALEYAVPLFDIKYKDASGVVNYGARVTRYFLGFNNRSALFTTPGYGEEGWLTNFTGTGTYAFNMAQGFGTHFFNSEFAQTYKEFVVWNLPGTAVPINNPPLAPVAGQVAVEITRTACRAAKPGYDVRTATPSQLSFDSSSLPAKVVAAGDIALPSGTTVYPLTALAGVAIGQLRADVIVYQGGTIFYPTNPLSTETEYGADYQFSGANIVFSNPFGAARARFIVYALDDSSPSAGDNDVWREFNDGTRDVLQFLRPGAARPPRLSDIMVDSRWPQVRILNEGYIDVGGVNGAQQWVVPLSTGGLFPFVKYVTVHAGGSGVRLGNFSGTISSRVKAPYTVYGYYDTADAGKAYYTAGDSTYCQLTPSEARFFTFRGLPTRRYLSGGSNISNLVTENDPTPIIGIRYYILGIPA
ncbi:hypothetical protein [Rhizobium sp. 2MFCol3.1]|uniref:hypothetical protein n=1 Tax=Rhizobium sp. 2MFCol3.1 TaxID=1246459 RepID=UPI00037ECBD1|nr:hypothetical protein [Rhizobium sp. 2MFCol3.1]